MLALVEAMEKAEGGVNEEDSEETAPLVAST